MNNDPRMTGEPMDNDGQWRHGQFYWNELLTNNVERAKAFFARTVGWTYDSMPMDEGEYTIAKMGEDVVAGIMAFPRDMPADTPPHWFAYIAVDDVDKRVAGVVAAGGQVFRPPFDVEGVGRIAVVCDATGGPIGFITPTQSFEA